MMNDKLLMVGYELTEVGNVKIYRNEDTQNLAIIVGNKEPLFKSYKGLVPKIWKDNYQVYIKSPNNTSGMGELAINIVITRNGTIYDLADTESVRETNNLILMCSKNIVRVFNKLNTDKSIIRISSKSVSSPNVSEWVIELIDNKILLPNIYLDLKQGISFYMQDAKVYEEFVLVKNARLRVYRNRIECDLTTQINAGVKVLGEKVTFLIDRTSGRTYCLSEAKVLNEILYATMYDIVTKEQAKLKYCLKRDDLVNQNQTQVKWND